ncbi:MAG: hypothetical protein WCY34_04840 [Candidatus Omnitrophota bacterium]|jgi:hypothetical protein
MEGISTVIPMTIIVLIFFFIVRVATIILKLTGMDERTAWFQSISAFTGTGFTTKEAETILEDRIRRKTIVILMVLGKVGVVSVIGGLFVSFGKGHVYNDLIKTAIILAFIFILYRIVAFRRFSQALNRFIEKKVVAERLVGQKTLEELFHLPKGYGLAQLTITAESREQELTLAQAGFIQKDILVLSIERKHKLISFPHASDAIKQGDKLLCYGLIKNIRSYA